MATREGKPTKHQNLTKSAHKTARLESIPLPLTTEQMRKRDEQQAQRRAWQEQQKIERQKRDRATATLTGKQARIDFMVTYLTEWHLESLGGYPRPGRWFGKHFFYLSGTGENAGKYDEIEKITEKQMLDWFARAQKCYRRWLKDDPDDPNSFRDALFEVEQDEK